MTEFQKYIQRYLDQIPSGDWIKELQLSADKTIGIYSNLTEEQSTFAYAEGKWTLKGLLLHLSDTERVFQYRILAFARGEKTTSRDLMKINTLISLLQTKEAWNLF
ncbi:DinB family protein [Chryseobacterium sp. 1B4]